MQQNSKKLIATNKKAFFEYLIFEKYQAGIVLTGTEIKSIRMGNINLKDSFVKILDGEVFLLNCHIGLYDKGNRFNHEEKRQRKLLLNKKEILKIFGKVKQDNYTIVPTEMYFVGALAKLEIALAKGKKLHDKRESIKKRELDRDIKRLK